MKSRLENLIYLAGHAPEEIPGWFKHEKLKEELPPEPRKVIKPSDLKAHTQELNEWFRDPCFDLPENLQYIQEADKIYWDAYRKYNKEDDINRYFQWIVFYAKNVLLTLENS